MRTRAGLHQRLIEAFCRRSEVHAIHEFGGAVEGQIDDYSDLDLMVCSNDLAYTQRDVLGVLADVSPILGIYYIRCEPTDLALMVMFKDYSPYHKIDLGIVPSLKTKGAFAPFSCLYDSGRHARSSSTSMTFGNERDSVANRLNDLLFYIPRFTKCLFRGDWDMYRRWTGVVEALAVLLYEYYFGWSRQPRYRLMPPEYKALHGALLREHREALGLIQPLDGRPNLPASFVRAVDLVVELYAAKAESLGECLDFTLARQLCKFLAAEVDRFAALQDAPAAFSETLSESTGTSSMGGR